MQPRMKLQAFSFAQLGANFTPQDSLVEAKTTNKKPTATLTVDVFQATTPTKPQTRSGSFSPYLAVKQLTDQSIYQLLEEVTILEESHLYQLTE